MTGDFARALLESVPDAIIVVDQRGRMVVVNQRAEEMFGYDRRELIGRSVEMLVPAGLRTRHQRQRELFSRQPAVRPMACGQGLVVQRKDGSRLPVDISLSPMNAEDETLIVSAVRDRTDRQHIERALRESEERFELAVQGSNAGIWDWDLKADQIYLSPRWKQLLGYEEHELPNARSTWEDRLHPDDRGRAIQAFQECLDGGVSQCESEHRLLHKDGTYHWFLARGAAVFDEHGKAYRVVGSHIDITRRKRAERKLQQREQGLLAAQRVQEQILPATPPKCPGLDLAGQLHPAEFAAGDLYDFLPMSKDCLDIVVGDVSGHGISSALVMASTHAYLHAFAGVSSRLTNIVERTNSALCRDEDHDRLVTLLIIRLNLRDRTLAYVNAGHPPGYLLGASGDVKTELDSSSLPLGVDPSTAFPARHGVSFEEGDTIFVGTDGIFEAAPPRGDQFGMPAALESIRDHQHLPAEEIVSRLYQRVCDFAERSTLADDFTAVVARILHAR
jgi:PAS domain S-box-containing protein